MKDNLNKNEEVIDLSSSAWRERVYIETAEHIIKGYIYMPRIGKKSRLLSEVLNTGKSFIAVKECYLEYKLVPGKEVEYYDFMQVNISSILIMRPTDD